MSKKHKNQDYKNVQENKQNNQEDVQKDINKEIQNQNNQADNSSDNATKDMSKKHTPTKAELEQMLKEEKDKYLRLYAEFENFRKRTAKEKLEMFETAAEGVIKNLLPVLDDFERAINEMTKRGEDELAKGVTLIYDKFKKTLEKEGLKHIDVKKGDQFDPEIHEAIAQMPVQEEDMKNKVVDVVEKGYQLGPKNIRFPKVVTGK
jgi:molecular chaperone GrpE